MYIPLETQETYNGGNQHIMKAGLVKGRNYLLSNGRNTGSYNRFMKCWSFDNDIINVRDHCTYLNEQSLTMQSLGGK